MILKPQDILVLLKFVALGKQDWSYNKLAIELGMSPSEVHGAVKRSLSANLAYQVNDRIEPNISNLNEFLIHGLKYVYVPDRGGMTRGVPTSYAGSPLNATLAQSSEPPPVWPDPDGKVRGEAFSPVYKSVAKAVRKDQQLYELLVLVDAIRGGRTREREIAIKELKNRLKRYGGSDESES